MFACSLIAALGATSGTVWADEPAADDAEKAGEGAEGPEEAKPAAADDAAAATSRWPRANIARPLTLPKGLANVGVALNGILGFDVFQLAANGGYGVSDDLELRASYVLTLEEFEAKGPLLFQAGYKLLRGAMGGKLEVIGRVGTGYDLLAEGVAPLVAGAQVQYNVSDKLAIFTSGNHLSIALEETQSGIPETALRPVFLSLPIGAGYQLTPEAWVQVDTVLANIEISDAPTTVLFADIIPLAASLIYNLRPELDITAAVGFADLKNSAGDNFFASVGIQYYLGKL
jgi:hypothetical protein